MLKEREISLADFHEQLLTYRREIEQTWNATWPVYEQFVQEEAIYPEHCDQIRNAIRKIRVPVRSFYRLLDTPSHLPLSTIQHIFSPAITLRQVDELTDELMVLILLFRRICPPSAQNMSVPLEEIRHKIHALEQGYVDILKHADRLLLRVLAQERVERQKLKSLVYGTSQ